MTRFILACLSIGLFIACTACGICGPGRYLKYEDGDCGTGEGTCADRPSACTLEYAPVCGCDGVTYSNRCHAAAAGISVMADGECDASQGETCGGIAGLTCPEVQFCKFDEGTCGAADQTGTCMAIPDMCTEEFNPVCGCDGVTYDNECFASAAGVSVAEQGPCTSAG